MSITGLHAWLRAVAIIGATFVSEDATCIATGLMMRAGQIGWSLGITACTLGIFLGDLGLWLVGRLFGRRVLGWRRLRGRLPEQRIEHLADWFDRRGWTAILAARFLPGTRLPVYVAAGVLGRRAGRFAIWALLAAALWTPALVLIVATLGQAVSRPLQRFLGAGWLSLVAAVVLLWLAIRISLGCATADGRARLWASVSRLWRWEFWPPWLFYLPLLPWIGWLALRHRGLTTATAANPGISPHGGVVGESKFEILSKLPQDCIVPSELIPPAESAPRTSRLLQVMAARGWNFPLILKPDAGQRGAGVRLVRDAETAGRCIAAHPWALLAQVYHPGPFEAGVFYYRMPGEQRGRVFSITDKQFPFLIGDGTSTVESLVWRHPRLRMQARTFIARMNGQADAVLPLHERLPLTIAGNHCQGTLFRDGAGLLTPELEAAIDAIARQLDGFYFGRFDVRFADPGEFRAGRGFAIIELNGVTSESTNVYDPQWPLLRAYRVLFKQWAILFAIGARNRQRGHRPSSLRSVLSDARAYYRDRSADRLSD